VLAAKTYGDFAVADRDPVGDGFDDLTLFFMVEGGPAGTQIARFGNNVIGAEVVNLKDVNRRPMP